MNVTCIIVRCDDDDIFAAVTKATLHYFHNFHHYYFLNLTSKTVTRRILKFLSALIKTADPGEVGGSYYYVRRIRLYSEVCRSGGQHGGVSSSYAVKIKLPLFPIQSETVV